jgi:sugar lactone lactonase YvrE
MTLTPKDALRALLRGSLCNKRRGILPPRRLLHTAMRFLGVYAFSHRRGVTMSDGLARRTFLCGAAAMGLGACSRGPESTKGRPTKPGAGSSGTLKTPRLLCELPDSCNTPDGMCLLPDNSVIVSIPNFNDTSAPPLLIRITPDNKAETFYRFPTPYPGLEKGVDRIAPMGISRAPTTGDLYLADNQFAPDKQQKSRLWKLVMKDGKVEKMVLVASGFNIANGTAVNGGYVYITESTLQQVYNPTMKSAVMRFKLDEENVTLKTPLAEDPHILATFESKKDQWPFGADGIAFDSKGNLFVGLFSDGIMYKITLDKDGGVKSNAVFAQAPGTLISCDGMCCDPTTDILYMADCAGNAIQRIHPDGRVETLARNGDVPDAAAKRTGLLDEPSEALVRGKEIVVANMDWPFDGFVNKKPYRMPATISVIKLE